VIEAMIKGESLIEIALHLQRIGRDLTFVAPSPSKNSSLALRTLAPPKAVASVRTRRLTLLDVFIEVNNELQP
jgi:hypothetical protein